ncbi:MAG: DUF4388 domain-containing protein [Planctomycetes bacterium]|nr:DUF4388 domain-containing protein [Planctomycetota bacterium]
MPADIQLRTYASLRSLETRALAIEDLIESIKRTCLHGGGKANAELVAATAELRWQQRKFADLMAELEASLGVRRGDEQPEMARREGYEPSGMRGTTDVIGVADLVGVLSSLHKTGTLALQSGEAMYVFEFQEGRIVHAITNQSDPDLRLGTILVAQNKLTERQLQASLAACTRAKDLLGNHLVHSATVSESDLRAALDVQVQRIFDQAFSLPFARFSFVEGSLSNIAQRTEVNTTHLLLEAARQADERCQQEDPTSGKAWQDLDQMLRD